MRKMNKDQTTETEERVAQKREKEKGDRECGCIGEGRSERMRKMNKEQVLGREERHTEERLCVQLYHP